MGRSPTEPLAFSDDGRGRPVVLLRGLTCRQGYWLRVVPLLDDLRVVALDFRGHGLSRHRDSYGFADYERDLLGRLARSIAPVEVTDAELELLAERSIEPADGGWRFRWDRAVLDSEAIDPFSFLGEVRCPTHVMAGALSDVMSPESARRFAEAIPGATLELVKKAGHHLELERPELVAERIRELAYSRDDR